MRNSTKEGKFVQEAVRERDENLKLALAAVVMAILLVSAAIIYVIRTTPGMDPVEPTNGPTSTTAAGETDDRPIN